MSENENFLVNIEQNLTMALAQKAAALPKNFNQTKFTQNCLIMLESLKENEKISLQSIELTEIVKCLMKGAVLGLDFLNKECYAIPYKLKTGKISINFQTDYKGERKIAKVFSVKNIRQIDTELVKEGDFFEKSIIDNKKIINFKPQPFNDGKIIGAFSIITYEDGSIHSEDMSVKEMDIIKKSFSKAENSPSWEKTPGEMYKKTVLRRALKGVEKSFETQEQLRAYEDASEFEFNNGTQQNVEMFQNPYKPAAIENKSKPAEKVTRVEGVEVIEEIKEEYSCADCGKAIEQNVYDYSMRNFYKPLCLGCQRKIKGAK